MASNTVGKTDREEEIRLALERSAKEAKLTGRREAQTAETIARYTDGRDDIEEAGRRLSFLNGGDPNAASKFLIYSAFKKGYLFPNETWDAVNEVIKGFDEYKDNWQLLFARRTVKYEDKEKLKRIKKLSNHVSSLPCSDEEMREAARLFHGHECADQARELEKKKKEAEAKKVKESKCAEMAEIKSGRHVKRRIGRGILRTAVHVLTLGTIRDTHSR